MAKLSNILLGMMNEPENKSKMEIDKKNETNVDELMQDLANIKVYTCSGNLKRLLCAKSI